MPGTRGQIIYERQSQGNVGPGSPRVAEAPRPVQATGAMGVVKEALGLGRQLLGLAANAWDRRKRAHVDDALFAAEQEFAQWRKEYNEENRGELSENAGKSYLEKWQEITGRYAGKFGGEYEALWNRESFRRGVHYYEDGDKFALRETQAAARSRLEGNLAAFGELCAASPEDAGRIGESRRLLVEEWERNNPGRDSRKFAAELDELELNGRTQAMFADGNSAGLEALLKEARTDTRGMPEDVRLMIRQTAARYGIPEQLALGLAMQESGGRQESVSHAGARGIMQLMPGTARDLGVNAANAAENIEGGLRYLSQLQKKYGNWRDSLRAYNMGPGGYDQVLAGKRGMPKETEDYVPAIMRRMGGGRFTADGQRRIRDKLEILARKREDEAEKQAKEEANRAFLTEVNHAKDLLASTSGMDAARRRAAAMDYLAKIPDPEQRGKIDRIVRYQLDFEDRRQKASDNARAHELFDQIVTEKMSPMQALAWLSSQEATPTARSLARNLVLPKDPKPNLANIQALQQGLLMIDQGGLASPEERNVFALNNTLSHTQWRTLMNYKGKAGKLSLTQVKNAAHVVGFPEAYFKKNPEALTRLFNQVVSDLKDGEPASTAQVQKILATYLMPGRMPTSIPFWNSNATYADAIQSSQTEDWLPDVATEEEPALDRQLKALNQKLTPKNRQILKKMNFGRNHKDGFEK